LQSSFILRHIRGLQKRLVNSPLVTKNAADGLVVEVLRKLEKQRVVDSWLGFLVWLGQVS
jgi:hypothetical protein